MNNRQNALALLSSVFFTAFFSVPSIAAETSTFERCLESVSEMSQAACEACGGSYSSYSGNCYPNSAGDLEVEGEPIDSEGNSSATQTSTDTIDLNTHGGGGSAGSSSGDSGSNAFDASVNETAQSCTDYVDSSSYNFTPGSKACLTLANCLAAAASGERTECFQDFCTDIYLSNDEGMKVYVYQFNKFTSNPSSHPINAALTNLANATKGSTGSDLIKNNLSQSFNDWFEDEYVVNQDRYKQCMNSYQSWYEDYTNGDTGTSFQPNSLKNR